MNNIKTKKLQKDPFLEDLKRIERCKISRCKSLKIGWNTNIKIFPEEIRKLKWLTSLTVSCTGIKALPDWIGELVNLRKFDISSNQEIKKLPPSLVNLENLKELNIDSIGIKALPSFIGKMHSLEYLYFNPCHMTDIPQGILDLPKLKSINVGNIDNAGHIPSLANKCLELNTKEALRRIKRCKKGNIKKLNLSLLYLDNLPDELAELNWLEELDLSCNNLNKLPDWFCNFKKLKILDLSINKLTSLPDSIDNLKSLKRITLDDNRLKTLPETFGNLSSLEEFYLTEYDNYTPSGSSWFKKLPDSFGNLSSLKIFYIYDTRLKTLPESFGNLKSLQSLSIISDAQLPANFYPETIKNLKSITELQINGFKKVPEFVAELKNLTSLVIEHNRLYKLPDFIGKLTKLKFLNLHSTWIKELPEWITNLTNLENLDISNNDISHIDPELPHKMPKLKDTFEWWIKVFKENEDEKILNNN